MNFGDAIIFQFMGYLFSLTSKFLAKCLCERVNGFVSSCGRLFSMVIGCVDSLICCGLLPFLGVMLWIVFLN